MGTWLNQLSIRSMQNGVFPRESLLEGSLFYPACGFDGSPVRRWQLGFVSFVFCDFSVSEDDLNGALTAKPFLGYREFSRRNLTHGDLSPLRVLDGDSDLSDVRKPMAEKNRYIEMVNSALRENPKLFATWFVFERMCNCGPEHGPERFSLIYIRGEGAATYDALYNMNNLLPGGVCIIRPGTGFGGNYQNFHAVLWEVINSNRRGLPKILLQWHFFGNPKIDEPFHVGYSPNPLDTWTKDGESQFQISAFPKIVNG